MLAGENRRKAQRFPLPLPLEIKFQESSGEVQQPATIRDISATGIYFLFDRDLPPDSKVEFYVRLELEGAPGGSVLLHCVGSIVRIEHRDAEGRVGVGARIDHYRFLRPGEGPEADRGETKH
ncbi:MAG: PilZ domain-containing protein [Candidatus Acidoferrales bacterium]